MWGLMGFKTDWLLGAENSVRWPNLKRYYYRWEMMGMRDGEWEPDLPPFLCWRCARKRRHAGRKRDFGYKLNLCVSPSRFPSRLDIEVYGWPCCGDCGLGWNGIDEVGIVARGVIWTVLWIFIGIPMLIFLNFFHSCGSL